MRKSRQWYVGFSLLELLITVAIVGILAALAYPSYQNQVAKARRNEATNALLTGVQALERYYSSNGRYTTTVAGSTLPLVYVTKVPENGGAYYNIAPTGSPTANTFTLKATRAGVQAGDGCGNFTLDETGDMSLADKPSDSSKALRDCWRR